MRRPESVPCERVDDEATLQTDETNSAVTDGATPPLRIVVKRFRTSQGPYIQVKGLTFKSRALHSVRYGFLYATFASLSPRIVVFQPRESSPASIAFSATLPEVRYSVVLRSSSVVNTTTVTSRSGGLSCRSP